MTLGESIFVGLALFGLFMLMWLVIDIMISVWIRIRGWIRGR